MSYICVVIERDRDANIVNLYSVPVGLTISVSVIAFVVGY